MNNFENKEVNNEKEGKIEINLDEKINSLIDINENDIFSINKSIDDIFKTESSNEETVKYYVFSKKEDLKDFVDKNIVSEKDLLKDNASFYINPENQEKMVFVCAPVSVEENYDTDIERRKKELKLNILSSFAHETTHMHQFFKKHGNEETANMWEQEQICVYVGEKTRGDISEVLYDNGLLTNELIDSFDLESGEWDNFEKGKSAVINYFYPFLIKEYGLNRVMGIWKYLQENQDIKKAIKENIKEDPEKIVTTFKEKIKNKDYLENIYD
jgi:hypothetical protein